MKCFDRTSSKTKNNINIFINLVVALEFVNNVFMDYRLKLDLQNKLERETTCNATIKDHTTTQMFEYFLVLC